MTRLVLLQGTPAGNAPRHDPNIPEGIQALRLLEANGFMPRSATPKNGQFELPCPFHEEPGTIPRGRGTNFYLAARSSQYYCQAASCGESGNLQTLEQFFGITSDPVLAQRYESKNAKLKAFEAWLTNEKREFLRADKGLNDETIERFRLGWDPDKDAYVIPYLEHRRPVAFRYYDPVKRGEDAKGRPVYGGPNGSKYWWEFAGDSIINIEDDTVLRLFNPAAANGDPENGRVFLCEGELKAMLLAGHGYHAVSIPGANGFKAEWAQYFMHAKEIVVLMDNDNPQGHRHDNCRRCETQMKEECSGHNPGQDAAAKLVDFFGFRARNIVLPLPEGERKVDINEYLVRDDHTFSDFEVLIYGRSSEEKYRVRTLGEIRLDPPPEAVFVVSHGLLPRGGRLLVTGPPKVGKSIFIENMVLSIASGIPFLHRFTMANDGLTPGHRVLLLDRELSERSLFDRFNQLIDERRGYAAAEDKLLIDHKFKLQLDAPNAVNNLRNLINGNGAEVLLLDTAYKFFSGDMENAKSVAKAFATLDEVIADTGVSVILTHHHRKGSSSGKEAPGPDQVMGSFLWTGWPNGTVLLNFKNRSVEDPYTTVASFVAFRDAAAPEPLLLKRDRESISYREITDFSYADMEAEAENEQKQYGGSGAHARPKLSYDALADLLIKAVPMEESDFLHAASAHFGMKIDNLRITLIDILDRHPDFVRTGKGTNSSPHIWQWKQDTVEETYEQAQAHKGPLEGQTTIEEMLA